MKTLRMKFANPNTAKEKMVSLNYARDDLGGIEVENAMDVMIAQNVLPGGPYVVTGADLVDRTVTPLM